MIGGHREEWQLLSVWSIVIIIFLLLDSSCYAIVDLPKYEVVDVNAIKHSYKEDINKIDINIQYAGYCQLHHVWEYITYEQPNNKKLIIRTFSVKD